MKNLACWFCNNLFSTFQESKKYCGSDLCKTKKVIYYFNYDLYGVQFTLQNTKDTKYLIEYCIYSKNMKVFLIRSLPLDSKMILSLPYESLILTPQNVEVRLPTLLVFS